MAYSATVIHVMIASPGDVNEERDIITKSLHDWNSRNTSTEKVVLLPVSWETHAAPDLSGRGQGLINERLLSKCDLLIGVFWTRLGTPTGEHASGTVEEIKDHVAAGKTAMVYFSSRPVVPGSYDQRQYKKLKDFKRWCQGKGLTSDFDSPQEFRERLRDDLPQILRDSPYLRSIMPQLGPIDEAPGSGLSVVQFDEVAVKMLQAAAQSDTPIIMVNKLLDGTYFRAGDQQFDTDGSPREAARLQAAVEALESYGLIRDLGYKGEVFEVTHEGYEAIDRLNGGPGNNQPA